MYLLFTNRFACMGAIQELNRRMGYPNKTTLTYSSLIYDVDGNYYIIKPDERYLKRDSFIAINEEVTSDEGTFVVMKRVNIEINEDAEDVTQYTDDMFEFVKQHDLSSMYDYTEVETVNLPKVTDAP